MDQSLVVMLIGLIGITVCVVAHRCLEDHCKHSWEILSEIKTESYLEQYADVTGKHQTPYHMAALENMCKKKLIQTFHCNKCGKLKRFVNSI